MKNIEVIGEIQVFFQRDLAFVYYSSGVLHNWCT